MDDHTWIKLRQHTPEKKAVARNVLDKVRAGETVVEAIRKNPLPSGGYISKSVLVAVYRQLVSSGEWSPDPALLALIRMKPVRTLSGVTTVTVLTKPYACPGKCIFCPTDVRMPKSYLPDEPGARRALQHEFDPYDQVSARLEALDAVGHPVDKIELLILGGTWSSYRRDYQEWFVRRCFDALNEVESGTLVEAQQRNETCHHRNVGLVVETRPDHVNPEEVVWLRSLGVTKVQMGAQSLDDRILALIQRGHTAEQTSQAVALLRAAGFKIVLHWMPNLLGATTASDRDDFARLWEGDCPDEIKIYPTQLLANAELYDYWLRGEYQPYTTDDLIHLIADIKPTIPRYCRVNRVIRDIPSNNVVEGNKRTSLRQDVQRELQRRGAQCHCLRCREVRGHAIKMESLQAEELAYQTGTSEEQFLSLIIPEGKIAGFLRLSLPGNTSPATGISDLRQAAIIREVHIYGQSLQLGASRRGAAQHAGLGTGLIQRAEEIARQRGFQRMAVISAIGTRRYYLERGYERGELYLVKDL
jgi:elongator complex protein 3